jgi:type I restriction enzyme S subunit
VNLEALEAGGGRILAGAKLQQIDDPGAGVAEALPGDVLFGKLRPYLAKTWLVDRPCFVSTELMCLRPGPLVDPRWLSYVAASKPAIEFGVATSDGSKMPRTSWEKFGQFRLDVPPVEAQQRFADFLDRETTRIDALIDRKRAMLELISERWQAILGSVIWKDVRETAPVMHFVDPGRPVMYGIVLPGPDVGGDGIPIVKGGDVKRGLSPDELARTTPEIEAPYARARLRRGDVLYAIRGGVGDVAIAPAELAGANITQDVARVAPRKNVQPDWLRYALQTPQAQADAESRITGATIRGLNIWELERLHLPLASAERQVDDLSRLREEDLRLRRLRSGLQRQLQF